MSGWDEEGDSTLVSVPSGAAPGVEPVLSRYATQGGILFWLCGNLAGSTGYFA